MTNINSVSIWEDALIWTQLSKDDTSIGIKRAVWEALPILINHQTIQDNDAIEQISSHLREFINNHQFSKDKVQLNIPGRFAIIKYITLETTIPEKNFSDQVIYEFEKLWEESNSNYDIYLPNFDKSVNPEKQTLAIAIRKNVLEFFKNIFKNAGIELEALTVSCFSMDELFKNIFPNSSGQILLLGWQRRGFDAIIIDNQQFSNYLYSPYTTNLDPIEKVDEFELANGFSNLLYNLQHPSVLEASVYEIQTIYNYGYFFKTEWLDFMRSRVQVPINLFNLDASTKFKLSLETEQLVPDQIFKILEPISNLF